MKKTREELEEIIQCSVDPILVYDKNGVIQYANPAFERVFGWPCDEISGTKMDFIPDSYREKANLAIERVISGQVVSGMEVISETKFGKKIHVRVSANALRDVNNKFNGIVVTLQDITELVASRQKALVADRAKQNFLSNISHEIRTPMNGLVGMLDLLESTRLDSDQEELVGILKKSTASLIEVINDILDFSKIESGEMECVRIDFDLRATMEEVKNAIPSRVQKKGLEVEFFVHQQVPALLKGDPGRLRQVMNYLLDNAVKFTHKGYIKISVTCIAESPTHATLRFEISDTGIGIQKDLLETIFESFSQADATSTRKYGGIGIGLSISTRLIQLMGGQMDVKSTPEKGSVFGFSLELKKQTVKSHPLSDVPQTIKHKKILVVDDSAANRKIIKEFLKSQGAVFEEAASSERAFEKIEMSNVQGRAYEIVLIAMQISGTRGEILAKKIRAVPQLSKVILIMLFAEGKRGDVARLEKIGVQGYLPLPINLALLFDCMTIALAMQDSEIKKMITQHYLKENRKKCADILLISSNIVNRKFIKNILRKSGYLVQAEEGREEINKVLQNGWYHVVLIDDVLHDLKIFQRVQHIQEDKRKKGEGNIAVLVLSEHDSEFSNQTADDYVLKPVIAEDLLFKIDKWSNRIQHSYDKLLNLTPQVTYSKSRDTIFNYPAALERAMDDRSFLEMLLQEFIKALPEKIDKIKDSIRQKDYGTLSLSANSLRGSAANIGAEGIRIAALAIENSSDLGDLDPMLSHLEGLEIESQQFKEHINTIDWGSE